MSSFPQFIVVEKDGKKQKPEVKITAIDKTTGAKTELTPKKDFKVKYKNNKDAGELKGKIKITFKKTYKAENAEFKKKIFSFTILAREAAFARFAPTFFFGGNTFSRI